jgi:hypothetical protein
MTLFVNHVVADKSDRMESGHNHAAHMGWSVIRAITRVAARVFVFGCLLYVVATGLSYAVCHIRVSQFEARVREFGGYIAVNVERGKPYVEYLSLSGTNIDDQNLYSVLERLPSSERLSRVDLLGTQIGDGSLTTVCQLPRLNMLLVSSPRLSADALCDVRADVSIQYLQISGGQLSVRSAFAIARCQRLDVLECDGVAIEMESFAALAQSGSIRHLILRSCVLPAEASASLAEFKNLASVAVVESAESAEFAQRARSDFPELVH